jgi:hypothetical protein
MKLPLIDKLDFNMKKVLRGASVGFVLKVIGGGLGFMFNVLLARLLGVDGAGMYFLALTVTTIATVFGCMGLDNACCTLQPPTPGPGTGVPLGAFIRKG